MGSWSYPQAQEVERTFHGQEEALSSSEAVQTSLGRARLPGRGIQEPTCTVRRCFYLKYSLSNMSVAKRTRGRPAWGGSPSNGTGARIQISHGLCAPNPSCQEKAAQQQNEAHPQLLLAVLPPRACRGHTSCSPHSRQVCYTSFSPTETGCAKVTIRSQDYL